ncbi:MAG TPA: universal stress protein [Candidatus Obscuribacterales bacterium]
MRVLIAVQDEVCVNELLKFVANYPWPPDVEFKILHVVSPVKIASFMSVLPSPYLDEVSKEKTRLGQELVDDMNKRLLSSVKAKVVTREVLEGLPKEEILDHIKDWKADMVILGSHRKHGAQGIMMGNVTQAVASHAPCSVIVVPLARPESSAGEEKKEKKPHVII